MRHDTCLIIISFFINDLASC